MAARDWPKVTQQVGDSQGRLSSLPALGSCHDSLLSHFLVRPPRHPQKQQLLLLSFSLRWFCWLELSLVRWAGGKSRPAGLGKTEACFVSAEVVTVFFHLGSPIREGRDPSRCCLSFQAAPSPSLHPSSGLSLNGLEWCGWGWGLAPFACPSCHQAVSFMFSLARTPGQRVGDVRPHQPRASKST